VTGDPAYALAALLALPGHVAELLAELHALRAELAEVRRALPASLGSMEQAAELTGLSGRTIRRRVRTGEIPARRVGRRILIDLAALKPLSTGDIAEAARAARGDS
jgi:excisionase family DNA binding protein